MTDSDIGGSPHCEVEVDGAWEFFDSEIRAARKTHRCGECGAAIQQGEKHEYAGGKWEGHLDFHRTCLTCVAIRRDLCPRGFYYGGLREQIWACYGVDYITGRVIDDDDEPSFDFGYW